jgi:TRAP-type C4-dicarboxylate transport system substrate-binding protein
MANGYSHLGYEPAVAYFVERVTELSDGALRVEVIDEWGGFATDFEDQIIGAVAAGEVDLGWVGTRAFDTVDVSSFQALTAPMLIDNYPLQEAVIESEIPTQMLDSLDEIGLAGLAVLADGMRKPIAVDGPLLGPDDWSGITFQTFRSRGQSQAIRSLGAVATDVLQTLDEGLVNGEIQGFEKNLLVYELNDTAPRAPYVTANVNLWPQTVAIVANPDRLAVLSDQHRDWLTAAADDATARSSSLADQDAAILARLCESGARFANASEAELTALRKAFAPVYEALRQNSQTAGFIDEIESLKESTPAGDRLVIPADCTGSAAAPLEPALDEAPSAVDVALNGVYRWTMTEEDAVASGTELTTPEALATYPWVMTLTLDDGTWALVVRSEGMDKLDATDEEFEVAGDRITFNWDGAQLVFTFSVDAEGNLELTPVEPMPAGDQFVWSTHPLAKIE